MPAICEVHVLDPDPDCSEELCRRVEGALRQGHRRIVLDLARLSSLTSSGIAAILSARARVVRQGGMLAVANLEPELRQVFQVLKLTRLFDLDLDREEAVQALQQMVLSEA